MKLLLDCENFLFLKFQNSRFENNEPYGRKLLKKKFFKKNFPNYPSIIFF